MRRLIPLLAAAFVLLGCFAAPVTFAQTPAEQFENQVTPNLIVPLPNFSFSNITVTEEADPNGETITRTAHIPFLADYLAGIYKYAIATGGIFATVLMMVGGFEYLVGNQKSGMSRIKGAVTGLVLVFGTYVILSTVSPVLVNQGSLAVGIVRQVPFEDQFLEEFGSAGDFESSDVAASDTSEVEPGEFRTTMQAACLDRNGEALPTYQEKINRLRSIVATWAEVGANQGGAIYIRGGSASCTSSNPQPEFLLVQVSRIMSQLAGTFSADCKAALDETKTAKDATKKKLSKSVTQDIAKKYSISKTSACYLELKAGYETYFMNSAKEAGLFCGDCLTTQVSLYNCWSKGAGAQTYANSSLGNHSCTLPPGDTTHIPECVMRFPSAADVDKCLSKLKFGDLMSSSGHVWMYTGGANLGFEILEMGGGGSGDITCDDCGGKLASKRAGLPAGAGLSGMRASLSARDFLLKHTKTATKKGTDCVWAWRPIAQ